MLRVKYLTINNVTDVSPFSDYVSTCSLDLQRKARGLFDHFLDPPQKCHRVASIHNPMIAVQGLASLTRGRIMARENGNENFAKDKDRQTEPVEHVIVLAQDCFDGAENQFRAAGAKTGQNVQQGAA